jgi:hypothetical protein
MATGIHIFSDADQVEDEQDEDNVFEPYGADEEQVHFAIRRQDAGGNDDGHDPCRCAHGELAYAKQIRESEKKQGAGKAADKVQGKYAVIADQVAYDASEPVEKKHIEENVEWFLMQEHVGNQSPGAGEEVLPIGGHAEVLDEVIE